MVQTSGHVVQVAAWCRVGPPGAAIMPRSGGVEDDPGKGRLAAPRYPPGLFLPKAVTSCSWSYPSVLSNYSSKTGYLSYMYLLSNSSLKTGYLWYSCLLSNVSSKTGYLWPYSCTSLVWMASQDPPGPWVRLLGGELHVVEVLRLILRLVLLGVGNAVFVFVVHLQAAVEGGVRQVPVPVLIGLKVEVEVGAGEGLVREGGDDRVEGVGELEEVGGLEGVGELVE